MDAKTNELLNQFKKPRTTNEAISNIFKRDVKRGEAIGRGWKHYVHLNKLIDPLCKKGFLEQVGEKYGPTNRREKIWQLKND